MRPKIIIHPNNKSTITCMESTLIPLYMYKFSLSPLCKLSSPYTGICRSPKCKQGLGSLFHSRFEFVLAKHGSIAIKVLIRYIPSGFWPSPYSPSFFLLRRTSASFITPELHLQSLLSVCHSTQPSVCGQCS